MNDPGAIGAARSRPRSEREQRKAFLLAAGPGFYRHRLGAVFTWAVCATGAVLGVVGPSLPLWIDALIVVAVVVLVLLVRRDDAWLLGWRTVWLWVARQQRRRNAHDFGPNVPARPTSKWLATRPPATVSDRLRAWVLTVEGKTVEARAIAEQMPEETALDRFRRASTLAGIDMMEDRRPDYSAARREAAAIDGPEGLWARASIENNDSIAALRAGLPLRDLTPPDAGLLRQLRLFPLDQIRQLAWRVHPLEGFVLVSAGVNAFMSIVRGL